MAIGLIEEIEDKGRGFYSCKLDAAIITIKADKPRITVEIYGELTIHQTEQILTKMKELQGEVVKHD